ncbi:MAG: TonB-dependent receptor, partial [Bacteroidetes bacterium]
MLFRMQLAMKRIYFLLSFGFLPFIVIKANTDNPPAYGIISGNVVDAGSKQPMQYVNVVVRNNSDSILTGGITDEKGHFSIREIPEGSNTVEIQFIGYEKIVKEVEVTRDQSSHNLSTINLSEAAQQLEEVEVRGELSTVTQKIDRRVINVGKDLTATGTSASELLNNVQSVSVDQQTGAISLRGNENVRILVDGRPTNVDPAQLLQQIPSSSIKSIELITNPSAKYNPEGMSGIINIILHKNSSNGFNGSVTGGITYGKNPRYNGALDLNYRRGIVNLFANYGGSSGTFEGGGRITREDNASISDFTNENIRQSHLVKTGADLYLNKANTLSVYTIQNFFRNKRMSGTMIYFEDILDSDHAGVNTTGDYTGTYNLNFKHDFLKEGHHIELEVSHSLTQEEEDARFVQSLDVSDPTSNYMDDILNDLTSSIVNLDYVNPLAEKGKLELGLEYRVDRTVNRQFTDRHQFLYDESGMKVPGVDGGFQTVPMGNTSFTYDRGIYSAYANYGHQFGKFSLQAGARVEQYDVDALFEDSEDAGEYKDSRMTVYPSAFVTYTP